MGLRNGMMDEGGSKIWVVQSEIKSIYHRGHGVSQRISMGAHRVFLGMKFYEDMGP
jgi:hypothetical protein